MAFLHNLSEDYGFSMDLENDYTCIFFDIFWKKLQQLDQVIFYVQMDRAIKTGVSREMILQKWFILAFYLEDNRNTSVYVFSTEIIWVTFDSIIEKS